METKSIIVEQTWKNRLQRRQLETRETPKANRLLQIIEEATRYCSLEEAKSLIIRAKRRSHQNSRLSIIRVSRACSKVPRCQWIQSSWSDDKQTNRLTRSSTFIRTRKASHRSSPFQTTWSQRPTLTRRKGRHPHAEWHVLATMPGRPNSSFLRCSSQPCIQARSNWRQLINRSKNQAKIPRLGPWACENLRTSGWSDHLNSRRKRISILS